MTASSTKKIKTATCWIALFCLVIPMFGSYFFDDIFSSVSSLFKHPELLELGWNTDDYGFYASGYSVLCLAGGLIVCGILLDLYGVRIVGSVFVSMMVIGAAMIYFSIASPSLTPGTSLKISYFGKMLFGLGSEIAGVAVTRSITKWFNGPHLSLAMGLHLAIARLGTAAALVLSPILVTSKMESGHFYTLAETARPAFAGLMILLVGCILWGIFVAMDKRFDKVMEIEEKKEIKEEDKFRFSDIWKTLSNPRFIMIALLCVFFYSCIISFKKFGGAILVPRFDMDENSAGFMLSMIQYFTVIFTPLFGLMVDKYGKATRWMLVGAALVFCSHLIIMLAPQGQAFYGYLAISLLGIGYSLVPSAMWPSIPKIIPQKNLGTAFSLTYWIQNMGLWATPLLLGKILSADSRDLELAKNAELLFVCFGIIAIIVALLLVRSSKKNPDLHLDDPVK